jgi:hypothetical protein
MALQAKPSYDELVATNGNDYSPSQVNEGKFFTKKTVANKSNVKIGSAQNAGISGIISGSPSPTPVSARTPKAYVATIIS